MRIRRTSIDLLKPGVVTGLGVAGTLDEIVLHQVLHWHHFYDRSVAADMVSDGLFHLASTACLVVGLYWAMAAAWRGRDAERTGAWRRFWAGLLLGTGGFNLFDGTVQHKLLRLHEVRMDVPPGQLLPYDAAFLGIALVVFAAGVVLLRRSPAPVVATASARNAPFTR